MQLAISQLVPWSFSGPDNFSDWIAGQQSIARETGFMFAALNDDRATAYYRYNGNPDPTTLVRGQHFVWIDYCKGLLPAVKNVKVIQFSSLDAITRAVSIALNSRVEFKVIPLPDDCCGLVVKPDAEHLFNNILCC